MFPAFDQRWPQVGDDSNFTEDPVDFFLKLSHVWLLNVNNTYQKGYLGYTDVHTSSDAQEHTDWLGLKGEKMLIPGSV